MQISYPSFFSLIFIKRPVPGKIVSASQLYYQCNGLVECDQRKPDNDFNNRHEKVADIRPDHSNIQFPFLVIIHGMPEKFRDFIYQQPPPADDHRSRQQNRALNIDRSRLVTQIPLQFKKVENTARPEYEQP